MASGYSGLRKEVTWSLMHDVPRMCLTMQCWKTSNMVRAYSSMVFFHNTHQMRPRKDIVVYFYLDVPSDGVEDVYIKYSFDRKIKLCRYPSSMTSLYPSCMARL